jgi:hypothetical protein
MPTTNVIVTATYVAQPPSYTFKCYPSQLMVTEPETTIAFEFGIGSAPGLRFSGLTAKDTDGSQVYSLSAPTFFDDQQRMTIEDVDIVDEDVNYTLEFIASDGAPYKCDPQILNRVRT